jgi:cobalt-zinc-cadmium efflux system membrane fusion protein
MSGEAQKSVGLVVAPAAIVQLTEYLHVLGTVQPIDSRIGYVRSLARGRVQDVLVRVGDRVVNGQPLARLDNIEAGDVAAQHLAAHAELQKLKVQEATAARQLERSRTLADIGAVAQKDLDLAAAEYAATAEAIKAQESVLAGLESKLQRFGVSETESRTASMTTIRSPFGGVVLRVQVAPGDVVETGTGLFSVTDLSDVWVQAEVYEKDLARVRVGRPALISVDTYPGETFSGAVAHISDTLDPKTRTAQVRCVVPNKDWRLKLDMFAAVDVPTTLDKRALTLPAAAVQEVGGKSVVFVRQTPDTFRVKEIRIGQIAGGRAEVLDGLKEGEPVVVEGAFQLKSVLLNRDLGEG